MNPAKARRNPGPTCGWARLSPDFPPLRGGHPGYRFAMVLRMRVFPVAILALVLLSMSTIHARAEPADTPAETNAPPGSAQEPAPTPEPASRDLRESVCLMIEA